MITDWLDPVSYKLGQAAGGGGGGGNPNTVVQIAGTAANPWGDYVPSDIFSLAEALNATVILDVTYYDEDEGSNFTIRGFYCGSQYRFPGWLVYADGTPVNWQANLQAMTDMCALHITSTGVVNRVLWPSSSPSTIPTTATTVLKLVLHPLP